MDTLAVDSDNRPVIIEYKADKSSTVLLQGLYYMDWLVENTAEFEKVVKNKLGKELSINWKSGVRLVLVAKSFEIWDKFAVNRIIEDVELYEYTLYENEELKIEKTTLPKDFRSTSKTAIISSVTQASGYTVEDHLGSIKSPEARSMVEELIEKFKLISDDIKVGSNKTFITFKSTTNFILIYPQKNQFWIDVKLPKDAVKKQFNELDVRDHKDKIYTHIRCNINTNIDDLVKLAELAFENTL